MKRKFMLITVLVLTLCFSFSIFAQETTTEQTTQTEAKEPAKEKVKDATPLFLWSIIVGGFGLAMAAIGGAWSQSKALRTAMENIGRNPAAADSIRGVLIIGLALIESLVIYVLLIDFIIYFSTWGNYSF